jgi:hypothetical protein
MDMNKQNNNIQQKNNTMQQNNMQLSNVNPRQLDEKVKNKWINDNIMHSGHGIYKLCPVVPSLRFKHMTNYDSGKINEICKVFIEKKNTLDISESLCNKGPSSLASNDNPIAILYPFGTEFTGTNFESREGIINENIILRSNYAYVVKQQYNELFYNVDLEKINSVVYSKLVTVIRDSGFNPLPYENLFKVAVITVTYKKKNDLIELNDNNVCDKVMTSNDILKFQLYIDTAFQAAICAQHDVLILSIFENDFSVPYEDQITIFNLCILKHGHRFKSVFISIPPYYPNDIFELFKNKIIRPQFIENDTTLANIIKNEKQDEMKNEMKENKSSKIKDKLSTLNADEKLKVLKKMISEKKSSTKNSNYR